MGAPRGIGCARHLHQLKLELYIAQKPTFAAKQQLGWYGLF